MVVGVIHMEDKLVDQAGLGDGMIGVRGMVAWWLVQGEDDRHLLVEGEDQVELVQMVWKHRTKLLDFDLAGNLQVHLNRHHNVEVVVAGEVEQNTLRDHE